MPDLYNPLKIALLLALSCSTPVFGATQGGSIRQAPSWISLYNGNETRFSYQDRRRIIDALNTLGVSYKQLSKSGGILVRANQRDLIQDLIAKIFMKSSRASIRVNQ